MKLVWPDTTVEDVGLARNISPCCAGRWTTNRANTSRPSRGRGYRFAAETANRGPGVWGKRRWLARWPPASRARRNRLLAVLHAVVIPAGEGGIASLAVVPVLSR